MVFRNKTAAFCAATVAADLPADPTEVYLLSVGSCHILPHTTSVTVRKHTSGEVPDTDYAVA